MLDPRILANFKSRNENPAYSILITGYDEKTDCSQEKLIIHTHQIDKSIEEIEHNANVLSKDLIIQSDMDYDKDNNAFKSTLIGYTNYNGTVRPSTVNISNIMSHYIEAIDTILSETITITFKRTYTKMPHVIPTIDAKYQSYYKSFNTSFIQDEDENYTGVIITFNKLKRKQQYPIINFVIIGDERNV